MESPLLREFLQVLINFIHSLGDLLSKERLCIGSIAKEIEFNNTHSFLRCKRMPRLGPSLFGSENLCVGKLGFIGLLLLYRLS